ncbi:MAG: DUF5979 domain-containing protein, partial [Actinomycetaceae bacterium]|nr:DUF5979 domain-containing protein [Actinomycetaceae bacterium]
MSFDVTSEPGLKRSRVRAVMATVLAAFVSMIGLAAPATAVGDVNVNNLVLVKSDVNGNVSSSLPIRLGDVVKLTFDWDGSNANLKANDAFVIDLPSVFDNLEHPQSRELKVDRNGEEVTIGQCDLTQKNITCVFNERVEELQQQGFTGFTGSVSALLRVKETRTEGTAPITVNGEVVEVAIPGGSIQDRLPSSYTPVTMSKVAAVINAASTALSWEVNFGSNYVSQALAEAGNPITVDGSTVSTLVFKDTLGPGQTFNSDASRFRFMMRNSAAEPDLQRGVDLTNGAGEDYTDSYGDFDLNVEIQGNEVTFTVTGPFAPDSNYKIYYSATPTTDSGKIQPGFKYTNEATLEGSGLSATFQRYYSDSFTVDVKMAAGFGTFAITKLLSGPGAGSVADETEFTTKVKYTLPGGATTDSYPNWNAPGTVNADKTGGEVDFTVTAGKKTNFSAATFPVGTIIELSEDPNTASPAASVVWGDPEFKVGNTVTNTLTIRDQTITAVELTNAATRQTGTFSVAKTGSGADVADKEFTFDYTCTDGQSGQVTVKGDGAAVQADKQFPVGTECTVTEDEASAAVDGYELTAPQAQKATIEKAGDVIELAFVNEYTPEPSPEPSTSEP